MVKQSKFQIKRKSSQYSRAELSSLSQALLQSAGAGIYILQEGKFVYVSPLTEELTGYSRTELLGVRSIDLVYPDDRAVVRTRAIENLKHPSNNSPYEFRFTGKSGIPTWVMEQVTSIEYAGARAVMGNFMDITEKKRIEEVLSHSEETMQNDIGTYAGRLF